MIQSRRQRNDPARADPAEGRLQPHDAAIEGGLPYGAARVGAQGSVALAGSNSCPGASGRSASNASYVPGITNWPEMGEHRSSPEGELMRIELPEQDGAGRLEPADDFGIVLRDAIGEYCAPSRCLYTCGVEQIFQGKR